MIPVQLQPEPAAFNAKVRIPGQQYLQQHPNAKALELKAFWQGDMLKDLWKAYSGICAYLCIYMELTSGAASVDHLVPKSRNRKLAYEWKNYRLACLGINRLKGTKSVLDPIGLRPNSFFIDFSNGRIYPNLSYGKSYQAKCAKTIEILDLDSQNNRTMRSRHFDEYRNGEVSLSFLQRHSPFVCAEIIRQGL